MASAAAKNVTSSAFMQKISSIPEKRTVLNLLLWDSLCWYSNKGDYFMLWC